MSPSALPPFVYHPSNEHLGPLARVEVTMTFEGDFYSQSFIVHKGVVTKVRIRGLARTTLLGTGDS